MKTDAEGASENWLPTSLSGVVKKDRSLHVRFRGNLKS
jgi:hypothetical protein